MKKFMALITGIGLTALASAGNQASLKHGEATTEYALVTNAIAHAVSGDTVTLLEDISLDGPDSAIVIDGKDITFDGDDHSVTQKYWSGTVSQVGDNVFRVKNGATVTFKDLYVTTMLGGENVGSMSPAFECLTGTHTTFRRVTSHTTRFLDAYGDAVLENVEVRAHPKDIATSSYPDCAFKFNGGTVTINSGRYDGAFYVGTRYGVATCDINGGTFYGMSGSAASFDYVDFNIANAEPKFYDDAHDTSRGFLSVAKKLYQQIEESETPGFLTLGPRETKWYEVKVMTDHATFYTNGVTLAAGTYSFPDDVYYDFSVEAETGYEDPKMTVAPSAYTNVTEVDRFVVQTNLDITVSAIYTENNYDVTIGGATTSYSTFAKAVAAAKAVGVTTISVHKGGVTLSESFPADANGMTLDLNGFTLTVDGFTIPADKTFTITGQTLAGGTSPLTVNGELDLTGVTAYDSSCLLSVGAAGKITAADGIDPNATPWSTYWAGCVAGAKFVSGTNYYNHDGTTWVLDTNKVTAYVKGVLTGYPTLNEAVVDADNNSVVTVIAPITVTTAVSFNKNLTVSCANDATITCNAHNQLDIKAGCTVTFKDATVLAPNHRMFLVYGTLIIDSGYYCTCDRSNPNWETNPYTVADVIFTLQANGAKVYFNGGTVYYVGSYDNRSTKNLAVYFNGGYIDRFFDGAETRATTSFLENGAKFRNRTSTTSGKAGVKTTLEAHINTSTQVVVGPNPNTDDGYYMVQPKYPTVTVNADAGATLLTNSTEAVTVDSFQVANGASLGVVSASTTTGYDTDVLVDGVSVKGQTLTITSNTTIRVELIKPTWTVTIVEDHASLVTNNNVTITGESSIEIKKGESRDFSAVAATGYVDPRVTIPGRYNEAVSIEDFVVNSNMTICVSARIGSGNYCVKADGVDDPYYFDTYADAVAFAKTKGVTTIMLANDFSLAEALALEDGYALDLNGHTIDVGVEASGFFTVPNGVSYRVTDSAGGGYLRGWTVVAEGGALDVADLGVRFISADSDGATVDGTLTSGVSFTPNQLDQKHQLKSAVDEATVATGAGTYDYSASLSMWVVENEVAKATDDSGLTDSFNSLLLAVDFAATNTTVLITADNTLAKGITIDKKGITIDGQGCRITATTPNVAFSVTASTATFRDLTLDAAGKTAIYAYGAEVVISNSTYTGATVLKTANDGTITVTAGTFSGEIEGDGFVINGGTFNDFAAAEGSEATIANGAAIFDDADELAKVKKDDQEVIAASTAGYYALREIPSVPVTIVKSTGIGTVMTNGAEVDFGSESSVTALVRKCESVTFGLAAADIIVPAFKVQVDEETAVCTNGTFTYKVVSDGETLTFTATAAGSDADITQDEAKRAIKESISLTDADKTAVEAKVDALCAEQDGDAKAVAKWIEDAKGGITSEAIRDSNYTKASMNLAMTAVITNGSPITVERVTGTGCVSTRYKIGTTVLQLGASETTMNYVQISTSSGVPGGWVPWGSASAELQAIVGISGGTITLAPGAECDYVYDRVVLPED